MSTFEFNVQVAPPATEGVHVVPSKYVLQADTEIKKTVRRKRQAIHVGQPLVLHFDGGRRKGQSSHGVVIRDHQGRLLFSEGDLNDTRTNNQAEVGALQRGLELVV